MTKIFILIFILLAPLQLFSAVCDDTPGVWNTYYGRVKLVEVFDYPVCGTIGRFRVNNAVKELYPDIVVVWTKRYFNVGTKVYVERCSWVSHECKKELLPWYKALKLDDFVIIDAKKYYGPDGKDWKVFHILILEGL